MPDTRLQLGPVIFDGFETPERVSAGGEQRLAIHRLPGGERVIDAMGRDDAEISFAGYLSGPDAPARAALLDGLRAAGATLPLTWDIFAYSVLVSRLEFDYRATWWIGFRLTCAVLRDESAALLTASVSLVGDIVADLARAASPALSAGLDLSALSTTTPSATLPIMASRQTVDARIVGQQAALARAPNLITATDAAGDLANLLAARAFLGRAAANLDQLGN